MSYARAASCACLAASLSLCALLAEAPKPIPLPAPVKTGGMPVMEALALRATSRDFAPTPLNSQQMSNLLWAAFGINRKDGKRTAPSSMDRQEIELWLLTPEGVQVYDAKNHQLVPVLKEDLRALGGRQAFVKDAPLTLVFVADHARLGSGQDAEKERTAAIDTGFISQNVYLFCASEGLATGVRTWVDTEALGKRLGLSPHQHITAAQSIGFPKKK